MYSYDSLVTTESLYTSAARSAKVREMTVNSAVIPTKSENLARKRRTFRLTAAMICEFGIAFNSK